MDWGPAFVAIIVALIAAGAGFAGGYLGSRWQAESNLAQWRRDRLLQFCADLLAAGGEIDDVGSELKRGGIRDLPTDSLRRLVHAYECIVLLSHELSGLANDYRLAVLDRLSEAPKGGKVGELTKEESALVDAFAAFAVRAQTVLLEPSTQPASWHDLWRRIASAWARVKTITTSHLRRPLNGPHAHDASSDSTGVTRDTPLGPS